MDIHVWLYACSEQLLHRCMAVKVVVVYISGSLGELWVASQRHVGDGRIPALSLSIPGGGMFS